ncbi:MAG: DedA family protein [Anaerolineae bacterium]|nr:DedA family protein [Anaerolineae bacterium]
MLADFIDSVTKLVENIVVTFGAPGITIIAFFENLFPPTPSEILYPLAGKMASEGRTSVVAVVVAGLIGSLGGSLLYYSLGYRLGETGVRDLIQRLGTIHILRLKIPIVTAEDFDRGLRLFRRHGSIIVFVARLMPLVHGVVSIPAGVVRMNLLLFCIYTALGAALWIAPLAVFGYWLGNNWQDVLDWLDIYENVVLAVMGLLIAIYVGRRIWHALEKRHIKPTH